jgi:TPR repeat protein
MERGLQRRTQEEVSLLEGELGHFAEKSRHLTQDIVNLREAQARSHASLQRDVESQRSAASQLAEEARSLSGRVSAAEQSHREERDSVGREVSCLARVCGDVRAKSDRLGRLFENGQRYRRVSEMMDSMNGYDEWGEEKSFQLGLSQLEAVAGLGHGDAQYGCGRCLRFGTGEKDFADVAKYFRHSADKRKSYEEARFGLTLAWGESIVRDDSRALEFCRRSSGQEDTRGQAWLRVLLQDGSETAKDKVRSAELVRLSAEQRNSLGQQSCRWALGKTPRLLLWPGQ